jgi:hypothetical protein
MMYSWFVRFRLSGVKALRCGGPLPLERDGEEAFILGGRRIAWRDTEEVRVYLWKRWSDDSPVDTDVDSLARPE